MPAGTISLTNNSTAVTGSGTALAAELKANDFLVAVVGGVTYTLGVKSVESATALTLVSMQTRGGLITGYGVLLDVGGGAFSGQVVITSNGMACRTLYTQVNSGGAQWTPWCYGLSSKNTAVDVNGFIKVASPVVKIFADGTVETNEESEGVIVTRQGVGQYLITGVLGMNSDASWGGVDGGFEIPVDRNKLPRLWLDYEMNPDGSILVKTYHRTHPEAPEFARNRIGHSNDDGSFTELVKNGEPVDIPADSFVSVRIEMPANSIWNQKQSAM